MQHQGTTQCCSQRALPPPLINLWQTRKCNDHLAHPVEEAELDSPFTKVGVYLDKCINTYASKWDYTLFLQQNAYLVVYRSNEVKVSSY